MNIDKLPSGNYRVRKMVNGKTYTLTLDHKPTEKEVLVLLAEKMAKKNVIISTKIPFKTACNTYIESKSNLLSPASVRGYTSIIKQISEGFCSTNIDIITKPMVQAEVNRYAADHSPKSTSNFSGFILSVLKYFGNEIHGIMLPQKEKKEPYIPTDEEVKAIFDEVKGTKYEVPIILAARGLRRSEICALTIDDILPNNYLRINKALVQDENKNWIVKSTKTSASTRTIPIPEGLADLIRQQGYVYNGFPGQIYKKLQDVQKKLGIHQFPLHKLRHYYATLMYYAGFSTLDIMDDCGWETDEVMKTVYWHVKNKEATQKKMTDTFSKLL